LTSIANTPLYALWGHGATLHLGAAAKILEVAASDGALVAEHQLTGTAAISDISGVPGGPPLVAVGQDGWLHHHFDQPSQWIGAKVVTNMLYKAWVRAPDEIYVGGAGGRAVRFDGTAWTELPRSGALGAFSHMFGIWGAGETIFAASGWGHIFSAELTFCD